ncbi:MAG: hypothetical protein Q9223_006945 [Gallowayella weberi]
MAFQPINVIVPLHSSMSSALAGAGGGDPPPPQKPLGGLNIPTDKLAAPLERQEEDEEEDGDTITVVAEGTGRKRKRVSPLAAQEEGREESDSSELSESGHVLGALPWTRTVAASVGTPSRTVKPCRIWSTLYQFSLITF